MLHWIHEPLKKAGGRRQRAEGFVQGGDSTPTERGQLIVCGVLDPSSLRSRASGLPGIRNASCPLPSAFFDNRILSEEKWLTNVGIFRAYVVAYLKAHPQISSVHTFLVRHLQPTEHGLPIQIYVFSSDTIWVNYENIQADIFDHILSVIPEFELRVFQNPSGYDLQKLRWFFKNFLILNSAFCSRSVHEVYVHEVYVHEVHEGSELRPRQRTEEIS